MVTAFRFRVPLFLKPMLYRNLGSGLFLGHQCNVRTTKFKRINKNTEFILVRRSITYNSVFGTESSVTSSILSTYRNQIKRRPSKFFNQPLLLYHFAIVIVLLCHCYCIIVPLLLQPLPSRVSHNTHFFELSYVLLTSLSLIHI